MPAASTPPRIKCGGMKRRTAAASLPQDRVDEGGRQGGTEGRREGERQTDGLRKQASEHERKGWRDRGEQQKERNRVGEKGRNGE